MKKPDVLASCASILLLFGVAVVAFGPPKEEQKLSESHSETHTEEVTVWYTYNAATDQDFWIANFLRPEEKFAVIFKNKEDGVSIIYGEPYYNKFKNEKGKKVRVTYYSYEGNEPDFLSPGDFLLLERKKYELIKAEIIK